MDHDVADFCRLLLFRHPELGEPFSSRAIGSGDAEFGHRGQATLVEWMKLLAPVPIHAVYSADQKQSRDGAATIAATKGLEAVSEARLDDQHMGLWQGRAWEEIAVEEPDRVREFFADFGEVAAPEGESLGAAVERFLDWWLEIQPDALGKTIAVVTSGAMVTGFAAAMLGMRLSRAVSLNLPHGGFGVLDVYANGSRISCWNPTAFAS